MSPEEWKKAINAQGVNPDTAPKISNVQVPENYPKNWSQYVAQPNPYGDRAAVQEAITMQQAAPTNSGVDPEIQAAIDAKKNQGQQRSSTPVVTTPVVETPASSVQTPAETTQLPVQGGFTVPADQPQQTEGEKKAQKDPNAIDFFNQILGPTPAEREAQQQRLLKQKRNMIAWTGLFDGLRQLANLYTASRGANNMQFTDNPYQTIEQAYQAEQKRQDANQAYANAYAKQMKEYKRQDISDKMKRDLQKAQIDMYKAREDDLKERRRLADEKNQAYINYQKALENKNAEQAAYWKAKAEGYPEELASKIAKNEAQRQKALQSSGRNRSSSGSRGNSPYYETVKTEGYDDNGNKVTKTEKRPLRSSGKKSNNTGNKRQSRIRI